jgi:hypothetical protein
MPRPDDSPGCWWGRIPLPQITTCDLDISIVGQLPPADLALHNEFEPGPVEVVGFDTPFGR